LILLGWIIVAVVNRLITIIVTHKESRTVPA